VCIIKIKCTKGGEKMKLNYSTIGKRIQECRNLKKITQQLLAEKIDKSVPYISHIETGVKHPSLKTVILIAEALEVTVDQLLYGNQNFDSRVYLKEVNQIFEGCENSYERRFIYEIVMAAKQSLYNYKISQKR